jgi:hypothetical protein
MAMSRGARVAATRRLLWVALAAALCVRAAWAIPSSMHTVMLSNRQQAALEERGEWIDMPQPRHVADEDIAEDDLRELDAGEPSDADEAQRFAERGAAQRDPRATCLSVPMTLCLGDELNGGTSVIAADSVGKGVVGVWTFDDELAQDSSGRASPVVPAPGAGPGVFWGASGYFSGRRRHLIAHHPDYSSQHLTISFWLFLPEDVAGQGERRARRGGGGGRPPPATRLPSRRTICRPAQRRWRHAQW